MRPTLTPVPMTHLRPTPITDLRLYSVGDVMRAFDADEATIRKAQQGFAEGVFESVQVKGRDYNDKVIAQTSFGLDDLMREGSIAIDTRSGVSVTAQLSRRLERGIVHCVNEMRRRGLRITYGYTLSAKGTADQSNVFARYGLVTSTSDQYAPGMRQVFQVTETRPRRPRLPPP